MNPADALAPAVARDARYTIQAYAFVFESLEYAKRLARRGRAKTAAAKGRPKKKKGAPEVHHVTGQDLCRAARALATRQFGMLAPLVLAGWGIRATSDFGNIVYNLIATGDMEKTPADRREDFDDVYDFATAFSGARSSRPTCDRPRRTDPVATATPDAATTPRTPDARKARFLAVLGLYLAWLLTLVALIVWTGSAPPRPTRTTPAQAPDPAVAVEPRP